MYKTVILGVAVVGIGGFFLTLPKRNRDDEASAYMIHQINEYMDRPPKRIVAQAEEQGVSYPEKVLSTVSWWTEVSMDYGKVDLRKCKYRNMLNPEILPLLFCEL